MLVENFYDHKKSFASGKINFMWINSLIKEKVLPIEKLFDHAEIRSPFL